MPYLDLITGGLGFLFTVLIFSYLLGDNPLFRIGTYIFVGVTAGYVAAVAMWQVIYPRLLYPLAYGTILEKALLGIPFLLAGLLHCNIFGFRSAVGDVKCRRPRMPDLFFHDWRQFVAGHQDPSWLNVQLTF